MNCGSCLMYHTEMVPLAADGSCPCCVRGHKQERVTVPPTWTPQDPADDGPEVKVIWRERQVQMYDRIDCLIDWERYTRKRCARRPK